MSQIPKVILMIESSRASGRALLRGIADYSHQHGPWSFSWETRGLEKAWPMFQVADAKGIILRDVDNMTEALACGLPTVVIGHHQTEVEGPVNVVTDSEAVGRLGAEHLISCGFERFAYCGFTRTASENAPWSESRREHFSARIVEAGFPRPAHFSLGMEAWESEREQAALAEWLCSLPKPVGVMACNDDCGQRLMVICKRAGLAVPDTLGLVGVDNDEVVCGLADPPMSSVCIDFERAGYEAAKALDQLMRGRKGAPTRIMATASHVAARRSTVFVATEDPHLRKALQFIRDHSRVALGVDEVALASGLSRRTLEKAFRAQLGRSILEEIRRVRTDRIGRMLVETNLPVTQIAEMLGFTDAQHIARYFRAGKEISPVAYRAAFGKRREAPRVDAYPGLSPIVSTASIGPSTVPARRAA